MINQKIIDNMNSRKRPLRKPLEYFEELPNPKLDPYNSRLSVNSMSAESEPKEAIKYYRSKQCEKDARPDFVSQSDGNSISMPGAANTLVPIRYKAEESPSNQISASCATSMLTSPPNTNNPLLEGGCRQTAASCDQITASSMTSTILPARKQELMPTSSAQQETVPLSSPKNKQPRINGAYLATKLAAILNLHIYNDTIYLYSNGWYQRLSDTELNRTIRSACPMDIQMIGTRKIFEDAKTLLLADSSLLAEPYRGTEVVCVCNGLYEIATGALLPHTPDFFLTSYVNVWLTQENASPATPRWDNFLHFTMGGDPDLIERVHQMFGYIFSNDVKGKAFFVVQGVSGSGKSVLLSVLKSMYHPDLISVFPPTKLGERFTGSGLIGKVVNIAGDIPDRPLPQEAAALIKALTGRDSVTVEEKYKAISHLDPMVRFLFATNFPFRLSSDDAALEDRLVIIPFVRAVAKECQNPELESQLLTEKEGIFLKAIHAYNRLKHNHYQFAGQELAMRLSNIFVGSLTKADSSVQAFSEVACCLDADAFSSTRDLFLSYQQFCVAQGIFGIENSASFSRMLHCLYGSQITQKKIRCGDHTVNGYKGIRLINSAENDLS